MYVYTFMQVLTQMSHCSTCPE